MPTREREPPRQRARTTSKITRGLWTNRAAHCRNGSRERTTEPRFRRDSSEEPTTQTWTGLGQAGQPQPGPPPPLSPPLACESATLPASSRLVRQLLRNAGQSFLQALLAASISQRQREQEMLVMHDATHLWHRTPSVCTMDHGSPNKIGLTAPVSG
ncbi:hypothetical protein K466DRAFT_363316 [Polyporus arcularius HHB13444]|uniref:Uncharacterized protein n=1 Tax=Polyporus arcularius HHB13444 TaxID=1314778 RepID=A0A5C3PSP5_9APHY|nr:hypothetical protein K466DRAFT_363316 [Polyporus arcularius HHB13444]